MYSTEPSPRPEQEPKVRLGYPLAWNGAAHPVITADTMAYTGVVEHALLGSALLWSKATPT